MIGECFLGANFSALSLFSDQVVSRFAIGLAVLRIPSSCAALMIARIVSLATGWCLHASSQPCCCILRICAERPYIYLPLIVSAHAPSSTLRIFARARLLVRSPCSVTFSQLLRRLVSVFQLRSGKRGTALGAPRTPFGHTWGAPLGALEGYWYGGDMPPTLGGSLGAPLGKHWHRLWGCLGTLPECACTHGANQHKN